MRRAYSTFLLCLICLTPVAVAGAQAARLDSLDAFVKAQMAQRHIRGLSLAIIKDGKIAVARAYGVTDDSAKAPVTTSTLFQAGSISKPVVRARRPAPRRGGHALARRRRQRQAHELEGARQPVHRDGEGHAPPIARRTAPASRCTASPATTSSERMPTLVQVLDGAPPANTRADPRRHDARRDLALLRRRLHGHAADDDRRHRPAVPAVHAEDRARADRDDEQLVRAAAA